MLYVLHRRIKAVGAYPVVGIPQTIDAYPDGVRINPQRKGSIRRNAYAEKHRPCRIDDIMNGMLPVPPEKRLASFQNQNPDTSTVQFKQ
jgi:hypothetical protein